MADISAGHAPKRRTAGLFDMRIIIAALIGLYGLIVLVTGFFTSDTQIDKADGLNINIAAGIGMLVVAALFAAWARWRPIVVPVDPPTDSGDRPAGH
jgi:drug/metabolite transporter (DMT)-like permease